MGVVQLLNRLPRPLRRTAMAVTQGEGVLGSMYQRLALRYSPASVPEQPVFPDAPQRIVIGPADTAEQGFQWARALERAYPGTSARSVFALREDAYQVRADIRVPRAVAARSPDWHDRFGRFLLSATHVVGESGIPFFGGRRGDAFAELDSLRESGVGVAVMFHGSEIRDPGRHVAEHRDSPFRDPTVAAALLSDRVEYNRRRVREVDLPVLVTTPDLLRELPGATWCPVTIDPAIWRRSGKQSSGRGERRPLVVHAPSNPQLKGSDRIDPALRRLDAAGIIEYRTISGIPYREMPALYAEADIVLDQFLIGAYGATACEAMAAGCVVVAQIDESTRSSIRSLTGLELPIVQASVEDIGEVIERLAGEVRAADEIGAAGVAFVADVHDGRRSAGALGAVLGLS